MLEEKDITKWISWRSDIRRAMVMATTMALAAVKTQIGGKT